MLSGNELKLLNDLSNREGLVLISDPTSTDLKWRAADLVTVINIAETAEEVATYRTLTQAMDEVFSKWNRIAQVNSNPQANPEELTAWQYDEASQQIRCTINSISLVGFISPETYSGDYVFEVQIDSTDGDDDDIGILLGYNGNFTTSGEALILLRNAGGGFPSTNLLALMEMGAAGNTIIASGNYGMKWPDGSVHPDSEVVPANTLGGWAKYHSDGAIIKLKVQRSGNTLSIWGTSSDGVYSTTPQISLDMTTQATLKKYLDPHRIGYVAQSQNNASWISLQRPGYRPTIIDIPNNNAHVWNGTAWTDVAISDILKVGALYFNSTAGRLYYMDDTGKLIHIASRNLPVATLADIQNGVSGKTVPPDVLKAYLDTIKK